MTHDLRDAPRDGGIPASSLGRDSAQLGRGGESRPGSFPNHPDDMAMLRAFGAVHTLPVKMIIDEVCREFNLEPRILLSPYRTKEYCRARFAVYWICRTVCLKSTIQIGRFTNRDHTTVIHGVRRGDRLLEEDGEFRKAIGRVKDALYDEAVKLIGGEHIAIR